MQLLWLFFQIMSEFYNVFEMASGFEQHEFSFSSKRGVQELCLVITSRDRNRPQQSSKKGIYYMFNDDGNKNKIYQLTSNEKVGKHFEFSKSISGIENHLQLKSLSDQSIIMHGSQTISTSNSESTLLLNGFPIPTYISYK